MMSNELVSRLLQLLLVEIVNAVHLLEAEDPSPALGNLHHDAGTSKLQQVKVQGLFLDLLPISEQSVA